ncbi:KTSC domain-containing protein [Sinorhizobium sp. CCBAU 05631]|uniref:KTSC domain-containing protein n=1 Tax=Sinorhizobium sp. CCBAU 05631 TaxID=794846 RepID=UPI001FCBF27B|nr:KTSC domain-containing protein [Sinorhizobium sp. CCBAU 05631]
MHVYEELLQEDSAGGYFNHHIRDHYDFLFIPLPQPSSPQAGRRCRQADEGHRHRRRFPSGTPLPSQNCRQSVQIVSCACKAADMHGANGPLARTMIRGPEAGFGGCSRHAYQAFLSPIGWRCRSRRFFRACDPLLR